MFDHYQGVASHVLDYPGDRWGASGHGWDHSVRTMMHSPQFWHGPEWGHLTGFAMFPAAPWFHHAAAWANYTAQRCPSGRFATGMGQWG